jgi:hypothetical protein
MQCKLLRSSCRGLATAATGKEQRPLFYTREVGFAQRIILAEIVVPEPFAAIWIIVEDREFEIGSTLIEV